MRPYKYLRINDFLAKLNERNISKVAQRHLMDQTTVGISMQPDEHAAWMTDGQKVVSVILPPPPPSPMVEPIIFYRAPSDLSITA